MWICRAILLVLLACVAYCKDCTYQYLPHKYINILNSITTGHKGLLASLYNVPDLKDCVRQCSFFENCHMATYQLRGAIGFCDLYYYHYPAKYKFEADSQLRIVPETNWPVSYVIFNINCKSFPAARGACYADKFQTKKLNTNPIKYIGVWEKTTPKKVLTVEQCIAACDPKAVGMDYCVSAVFSPPSATSIPVLGNCHRLKGLLSNQITADIYLRPDQVLVGNAQCHKAEINCRYEPSKVIFGSINELEMPADVHYGTEVEMDCAKVCGRLPDCTEAEFQPATNSDPPLCYLYRNGLSQSAKSTLHTAYPRETKIRLSDIECLGVTKQSAAEVKKPNPPAKASKLPKVPIRHESVAQQLSKFPSRPRNGYVSTPQPPVTLSLPSVGAKVSGYRLDELIAAGGSIPAETNPSDDNIDAKFRSN